MKISESILKMAMAIEATKKKMKQPVTTALEVAKGMKEKTLPPFIGIRIKPFTEEMKERGLRTLDIFVSTLVKETGGKLPDNFIVMLPKVTIPEQPATLASFFDILGNRIKNGERDFKNGDDGGNHTGHYGY